MPRYRTPLRYPGGKQRLAKFFAEILEYNNAVGWTYAEPYAGGAGVAMELLLDRRVKRVHLNDSSVHIYAFWKTMLSDPETFCRRISRASLTVESWRRHREVMRHPGRHSIDDVGFSTFFLNRCNRSGVLTGGLIGGLNQVGEWLIDARFPRNELIRRVEAIAARRRSISITNLDAEVFMEKRINRSPVNTLVYCDPPYFSRAERLYLSIYRPEDHMRLAQMIQRRLRRPWLVSYDSDVRIEALYGKRRQFKYSLQYSASRSYQGRELFIFSDKLMIPATSAVPYISKGLSRLRLPA